MAGATAMGWCRRWRRQLAPIAVPTQMIAPALCASDVHWFQCLWFKSPACRGDAIHLATCIEQHPGQQREGAGQAPLQLRPRCPRSWRSPQLSEEGRICQPRAWWPRRCLEVFEGHDRLHVILALPPGVK
mmetsp:Transcript_16838/g.49204  ORF Transcript_16838/g.49204 Transcript_16838/m.49204 type:complete len:130 (-) Transcript_16838:551-940(-)